jgi:peroxiredoxin
MPARSTIAVAAACALAWTAVTTDTPKAQGATFEQTRGQSCAADAKPAALDFVLKDVRNRNVKLSDFRGNVILLNFWATWCVPCRVEIPWFIEFHNKYAGEGLQVVGISADDPLDTLRPFVADMKMTYPVLQGLGRNNLLDAYGPITSIPVTVLISRDGRICSRHTELDVRNGREILEREIRALL